MSGSRLGMVLEGRYRITEEIASGAMGTVYRGERLQLGRSVAIKFLHARVAESAEFKRRFAREAKVMSRLSHPHCVSVIDFGVHQAPYLVMEFVAGRSLAELLDRGPLEKARALHVARQILAGLAHAHDREVVHRDIKPGNAMLTEATGSGDHIRLLDFGLAKLLDSGDSALSTGQVVVGTPSYMSPEQARGENVDARSDLYSTGVVLFELLTGEKPLHGESAFETLRLHCEEKPPSLSEAAPGGNFSRGLEKLIARALEKRPEDRFQSAIEFAEALDAVDLGAGADDARARTATKSQRRSDTSLVEPARSRRRRPVSLAFVAMIMFLAIGASAYVLSGGEMFGLLGGEGKASERSPAAGDRASHSVSASDSDAASNSDAASVSDAASLSASDAGVEGVGLGLGNGDGGIGDGGIGDGGVEEMELLDLEDAGIEEEMELLGAGDAGALEELEPEEDAQEPAASREPAPPDLDGKLSVEDAERLIRSGRREHAIATLRELRRRYPKSWYVHYLLGNLYFEKRWWSEGLKSYHRAVGLPGRARGRATLIRNAIKALQSKRTRWRARRLLLRVGRRALPHLRRAARSGEHPAIRHHAKKLAARVRRR